jgi:hypothetical protein
MVTQYRLPLYGALVFGFAMLVALGAAIGTSDSPRVFYLCALFAICATPLLYINRLNGRHAILCVFLAVYFVFYGALDLQNLFSSTSGRELPLLTMTELTVLCAAPLVCAGFAVGLRLAGTRGPRTPAKDWSVNTAVVVGLLIWAVGTIAIWTWQVHFQRNGVETDYSAGQTILALTVLGRMMQPLGVLILAYGYLRSRSRTVLALLISVVLIGVVVGFFGDSKELGMRSALIVILAAFLVEGKVPKVWIAALIAFVVFAFPIFQGYRAEIIMARGASRAHALEDIGRTLDLALSARDKAQSGRRGYKRAESFLKRSSLKGNLELVLSETGKRVEFQNGKTLWPIVTAFIPRLIWPEKPDAAAGQLFNQEFRVSADRRTYVSPTHLGELYWNFGWAGVFFGMPLIGVLMGAVNGRCDLSQRRSLTRLLIIVTTIYATCVRFEGGIAIEYIVWLRSLGAILILHWLFARVQAQRAPRATLTAQPA